MEPIVIGISDEERRRRERDEQARQAAAEALDRVAPQLEALERGGVPDDDAGEAARAPRGRPYAETPGARRMEGGAVVLPGVPQTPETIAEHQRARDGQPEERPSRRIELPEVSITAGEPEEAPRRPARPSPAFSAPMPDPAIVEDARQAPQRAAERQAAADEMRAMRATAAAKAAEPTTAPARLDDGLPTEGQIGDARARDVARLIAAALGNAFAGYSGRGQMVQPRREADELTRQRQQGIARREQTQREDDQRAQEQKIRAGERADELALQQARIDAQRGDRDASLELQRQRLGLDQQRVDADLAERQRTRAADDALDLPDSTPTRQARTALMVRLSQLHPTQRAAALEALGGAEAIQAMTGREAQRALAELARPQVYRGTGGGGGGGGAAARRGPRLPGGGEMSLEDFSRLYQERTGRSAEEAELVYSDRNARDTFVRSLGRIPTRQASADGSTRPILPGVAVSAEMVDDVTYRQHRQGLIHGRHAGDSLRAIREVQRRYGASAVIDPRARAELAAPLQRMLTRIAQMRSSGIIQPSELPTIEAFLPDPSSSRQITIGEFESRMRSFMRDIEDDVRATLEADGASAESIENALRYVRGQYQAPRASARQQASGTPRAAAQSVAVPREARRDAQGNVVMYGPQGARRVPPDRVAQRQAEGWTFAEGGR